MKNTGWITFVNKLPYSAVDDRAPAYDFPILVAYDVPGGPINYEVSTAKLITEHYLKFPKMQPNILAWRPIDEYVKPRG